MMYILDFTLTTKSVSIESDEYGTRSYVNSARGRALLEAECPTEIVTEVYKIWGNNPAFTEPTLPAQTISTAPTLDDRVKALEAAQLSALGV